MALWGKADSIFSPGTVTVDYTNKVITGSGTSFLAASVGSVITIGAGATVGKAVISGVTSETQISIATTQYLSGVAAAGVAYTMSQQPIYAIEDTNYSDTYNLAADSAIVGFDVTETTNSTSTKNAVAHAGWVGVHTYVDMHGNLRVKSETLVAFSGISTGLTTYTSYGDAIDDTFARDNDIIFLVQPTSQTGVSTTSNTSFTVLATSTPTVGVSTQWFYAYPVGAGFTALSNDLIFSTVTGSTVGIASTTVTATRPDGWSFKAVVTGPNGETEDSSIVTLNYA